MIDVKEEEIGNLSSSLYSDFWKEKEQTNKIFFNQ